MKFNAQPNVRGGITKVISSTLGNKTQRQYLFQSNNINTTNLDCFYGVQINGVNYKISKWSGFVNVTNTTRRDINGDLVGHELRNYNYGSILQKSVCENINGFLKYAFSVAYPTFDCKLFESYTGTGSDVGGGLFYFRCAFGYGNDPENFGVLDGVFNVSAYMNVKLIFSSSLTGAYAYRTIFDDASKVDGIATSDVYYFPAGAREIYLFSAWQNEGSNAGNILFDHRNQYYDDPTESLIMNFDITAGKIICPLNKPLLIPAAFEKTFPSFVVSGFTDLTTLYAIY